MKLTFIVEDNAHDKSAGLNIKEEARKNKVSTDKIINQILIKHNFNYYIPDYNTGVMFISDTRIN